jgi:hypothetical protein
MEEKMLKKGFITITCFCLILSLTGVVQAVNGKVAGKISTVKGEVLIFHKDDTKGIQAKPKDVLYQYDTIQTMKESRVQILMEDDSLINLGENAKIHLKEYLYAPEDNRRSAALDLLSGKGRFIVGKLFAGRDSKFQVNTSTSVIGVRDTHFIVWVVSPELTTVITIDGRIVAKNAEPTLICESTVGKDNSCQIASNKCPTTPTMIPAEEMQRILIDTQITPSPPSGETPSTSKDAGDIAKAGSGEKVEVTTGEVTTPLGTISAQGQGNAPDIRGNSNLTPTDQTGGAPPIAVLPLPPPTPR